MTDTEAAGVSIRLLTTAEVREQLGIGRTKFWEIRKQLEDAGTPLRPVRIGHRTLRWHQEDISAYIAAAAGSP